MGTEAASREESADGTPDHVVMADPEGNEFCVLCLTSAAPYQAGGLPQVPTSRSEPSSSSTSRQGAYGSAFHPGCRRPR
ncbi:hypothetical protein HC031_23510 [Planosporangium thailandense]|uniref:Glyoxalase-like domain-containing protein n=1 Tax=Planosporangium thailandense TaxID=765197 RepID=A0ABX0Y3R7_9ACTN|nr:hypothetical protein [Planosporangium thailandense]